MSNEKFNYYEDVSLEIGGKIYTVGNLIDMNEQNFNFCYENYKTDIRHQIYENAQKEGHKFGMLAISDTIGLMERIRLERRLNKFEGKFLKN